MDVSTRFFKFVNTAFLLCVAESRSRKYIFKKSLINYNRLMLTVVLFKNKFYVT